MSRLSQAAEWLDRAADIYGDDPALEAEISSLASYVRGIAAPVEGIAQVWGIAESYEGWNGRDSRDLPDSYGLFLSREAAEEKVEQLNKDRDEFNRTHNSHIYSSISEYYFVTEYDLYV